MRGKRAIDWEGHNLALIPPVASTERRQNILILAGAEMCSAIVRLLVAWGESHFLREECGHYGTGREG